MPDDSQKDILHGVTLEVILTRLHAKHGWEGLYDRIKINCFTRSSTNQPKFLRRTPWAREKVENLYCYLKPEKTNKSI